MEHYRKSEQADLGQEIRKPEARNRPIAKEDEGLIEFGFKESKEAFKKILEGLREQIDNGEYGMIIGSDASGRLPALIISKVIKSVYEEKGYPSPSVLFLAGDVDMKEKRELSEAERDHKAQGVIKFLNNGIKGETSKKCLIVTECLYSGISLSLLYEILKNRSIKAEIATLYRDSGENLIEELRDATIVSAQSNTAAFFMWNNKISGVVKDPSQLHSVPYYKMMNAKREGEKIFPDNTEQFVKNARENVEKISSELLNWYHEPK